MTGVLGIVYRAIATHLIHKAGYTKPAEQDATAGRLVQLRYASRPFNTPKTANLTDAAGCRLANWAELAWSRLNQRLASAVFSSRGWNSEGILQWSRASGCRDLENYS